MAKESLHDGFTLPAEGEIADRPHRAYDVEVDQATYDWLQRTAAETDLRFVGLGQVGFVMKGDGPKAILAVADAVRGKLPRVTGDAADTQDTKKVLSPQAIERRERIAQRLADAICHRFLEFTDLDRVVAEGVTFTFPPELIADVGLQVAKIPSMTPDVAGTGWLVTPQPSCYPRKRWLDELLGFVRRKVEKFLIDQCEVKRGSYIIHAGHYGKHRQDDFRCTSFQLNQNDLKALISDGLRVKINDNKALEASLNFSAFALIDRYRAWYPERLGFPPPNHGEWKTSPLIAWKSPGEKAA